MPAGDGPDPGADPRPGRPDGFTLGDAAGPGPLGVGALADGGMLPPTPTARLPWPRALLRGGLLLAHFVFGLWLALLVALDLNRRLPRERLAGFWSRRALRLLGVRVRFMSMGPAAGTPGPRAVAGLWVANHVSWLDIPVMSAVTPVRFVAKSEIGRWPVVGWLARGAGTLFIRRGKGGSGPLLRQMEPCLVEGGRVMLFPEGTTTDGQAVGMFHPRLFGAAIDTGAPVRPVALAYGRSAAGEDIAPFVGSMTLAGALWRFLSEPGLEVRVGLGPVLEPQNFAGRDALAAAARDAVCAMLAADAATARAGRDFPGFVAAD